MSLSDTIQAIKAKVQTIQEKAYQDIHRYAILDDRGETWFVKAKSLEDAGERFLEERIRARQPFPRPDCGGPPLWVRYETDTVRIIVCQARHIRDLSNSTRK